MQKRVAFFFCIQHPLQGTHRLCLPVLQGNLAYRERFVQSMRAINEEKCLSDGQYATPAFGISSSLPRRVKSKA